MKFGITNKIYYDEFLSEHICSSCGKNFSTKLVIYCKAFATGFTWWAWNKQGYIECNSCGAISDIRNVQVGSRAIRSAYSLKSIPAYNYIPSILVGGVLALGILGTAVTVLYNISTDSNDKFQGMWEDQSDGYALFVYNNNDYTFVSRDTIIFSKYNFDSKADQINIPIKGEDNIINGAVDETSLRLHVSYWEDGYFVKTIPKLRGNNPYLPEHNQWRIKATHEESPTEIRKRVLDYLYYLRFRYEWALNNNLGHLPVDPCSPLLQAEYGIGLTKTSMQRWAKVFYSKSNLDLANHFLYITFPNDIKYDASEPSVYKRNLKGIEHYIQVAEATPIRYPDPNAPPDPI